VLDKVLGAKNFMAGKAEGVSGIEVLDDQTLRLTLTAPFAPFLGLLAMSTASAVPQEVVERYGKEFASKPEATVGTGPFILKEWAHNNYLLLQSNKDYFPGAPYVDGVRFSIIAEPLARLQEFRSGNLDHTDIPPDLLADIRSNEKESKLIVSRPILDIYNMGFNCQKPPFRDNPKLRQAFNYAIDRDHLIKNVMNGLVEEAKGFVPPGIADYNANLPGYSYDPEKARQLLSEAGFPEGKGLPEITLYYDSRPPRPDIAQVVIENLARIGVKIKPKQLEWSSFLEAVDAGEPAFFQLTWLADYPDPENFLYVLLDSKQWGPPGNSTRYSNNDFDKLVEEAGRITDTKTRWDDYSKAEKIAFDDAPWLFLFWQHCNVLVAPEVHGLEITSMDRAPVLPSVRLEKVWLSPK
jgi:peptide/nickel transport system substrate-binding protein/oligopeptide transport system substrate-binding protein